MGGDYRMGKVWGLKNWFDNKISFIFNRCSAQRKKLQRDFNIIAFSKTIVALIKIYRVFMAGMLIPMMLVFRRTVVVIVKKFKCYNLALLARTDDSLSKAAPIGKEAGDDQKPDSHIFSY